MPDDTSKTLYKFVQVQFGRSYKRYDYLCDLDDVHTQDYVYVPVGCENVLKTAKVTKVYYAHEDELEHGIWYYKRIMKKADGFSQAEPHYTGSDSDVIIDVAPIEVTNTIEYNVEEPVINRNTSFAPQHIAMDDVPQNETEKHETLTAEQELKLFLAFEVVVAVITYFCMDTRHLMMFTDNMFINILAIICIFFVGAYFYWQIMAMVLFVIRMLIEFIMGSRKACGIEKSAENSLWFPALMIAGWIVVYMYSLYHPSFFSSIFGGVPDPGEVYRYGRPMR